MPTKNDILTEIYKSAEIVEVLNRIQPDYIRDDLKQHVFLLLLEKPDDFIFELHKTGKLRNYTLKIIIQLERFTQDKFHRVNQRHKETLFDFNYEWIPLDELGDNTALQSTQWTKEFNKLINTNKAEEPINESELVELCEKELANVYWYNRTLFKMYLELGNYRAVGAKTGISFKSVYNAVKLAKDQIKQNILCQLQ